MSTIMSKDQAAQHVASQRIRKNRTWRSLAEDIGKPTAWTIASLQGQHPLPASDAETVGRVLDLDAEVVEALQRQPYRGTRANSLPSDPTIYRFYEALDVYGPAIKEIIHEDFGDGIMSAVNFNLTVERRTHDDGDRVVVTFDGKFLAYQHDV
ncbi:cyanate lyase [Rhodococcus sp. 27YEA15]|uniref:cyanase n=1 Tax=Rhodococcus sp. 27YEA15 TaxID=3156259 RepID=UPI003C7D4BF6